MNTYSVNETVNTPKVVLDASNNHLSFEGDSRPEDVQKFYDPITDWLNQYENHLSPSLASNSVTLTCDFKLEYFNSASAKYVMDIINQLGDFEEANEKLTLVINWHYDDMDEDMLDAGQEFESMLNVKFNFIADE